MLTPADREEYWTKIIGEARDYAAGILAYCRDHGVSKKNYYYWFKQLKERHPEWADRSVNAPRRGRKMGAKNQRSKMTAETEVIEKPRRRKFSADYKAQILKETDSATRGDVAAILRREGLYSSHLNKWRYERDLRVLAPQKRGRKGNPLTSEVKKLRAQNAKLEKQLHQANKIIELQKKVSEILGVTLNPIEDED